MLAVLVVVFPQLVGRTASLDLVAVVRDCPVDSSVASFVGVRWQFFRSFLLLFPIVWYRHFSLYHVNQFTLCLSIFFLFLSLCLSVCFSLFVYFPFFRIILLYGRYCPTELQPTYTLYSSSITTNLSSDVRDQTRCQICRIKSIKPNTQITQWRPSQDGA